MKTLAILSLVLAAGAAMAAEPGSYNPSTAPGAWSRAAVQADFSTAMKGDMLPQTGEVGTTSVTTTANTSRDVASVRAEARIAVRAHQTIGGEV
jgi:hypothetical protein